MRISTILFAAMLIVVFLGVCTGRKHSPPSPISRSTPEQAAKNESRPLLEASSVLAGYCELDSSQSYEELYDLLSKHRKESLEKYQVRNAKQYRDFRESSEARWSEFVLEKRSLDRNGVVIIDGHAKIEESGVVESVSFKAKLIQENGGWKVDDWKY